MGLRELIDQRLDELGKSRQQLADTLGMHRGTLRKLQTNLPKPQILHAIAEQLEVSYSHVLRAAFEGAGYTQGLTDLLHDATVYVVHNADSSWPEAVFTDKPTAEEFAKISHGLSREDFDCVPLPINGRPIPDAVRVYTTVWLHHDDKISTTESLHESIPDRLLANGIDEITAAAIDNPDGVYQLYVSSLRPEDGQAAIAAARDQLAAKNWLLPPAIGISLHSLFSSVRQDMFDHLAGRLQDTSNSQHDFDTFGRFPTMAPEPVAADAAALQPASPPSLQLVPPGQMGPAGTRTSRTHTTPQYPRPLDVSRGPFQMIPSTFAEGHRPTSQRDDTTATTPPAAPRIRTRYFTVQLQD